MNKQEKIANEILSNLYNMYVLRNKAMWENEESSIMITYNGKIEEPEEEPEYEPNTYLEFNVLINRDYDCIIPIQVYYQEQEQYKVNALEFISKIDRAIFCYYKRQEHEIREELWGE